MDYENNYFMPNGWENQSGNWLLPNSNVKYNVVVNLEGIMQQHTQAMLVAFQMGREARILAERQVQTEISEQQYMPKVSGVQQVESPCECYVGVYDRWAYGIYSDQLALDRSQQYWDLSTQQTQNFKTYEQALDYARNGTARLRQLDASMLPDMQYSVNWRQKI